MRKILLVSSVFYSVLVLIELLFNTEFSRFGYNFNLAMVMFFIVPVVPVAYNVLTSLATSQVYNNKVFFFNIFPNIFYFMLSILFITNEIVNPNSGVELGMLLFILMGLGFVFITISNFIVIISYYNKRKLLGYEISDHVIMYSEILRIVLYIVMIMLYL